VLSVRRCRELLGADAPTSDKAIEELRNQLYEIAAVWLQSGAPDLVSPSREILASLPDEIREEVEERAAVMEFDGGMVRTVAERTALGEFATNSKERIH
jgi:hypothetical protein